MLQQYLPLAVLKPATPAFTFSKPIVATVPTACGIETYQMFHLLPRKKSVATVPTACGIETHVHHWYQLRQLTSCCNSTYRLRYWNSMIWPIILGAIIKVATVPTACGIETIQLRYLWYHLRLIRCNSTYRLRYWNESMPRAIPEINLKVATVLTACGIETQDD